MLRLVSYDSADIIDLRLIKQHLRIDDCESDELLRASISGAADMIARETTRILRPTVYEWRLDAWPAGCRLELPVAPVRDVLTVTYIDAAGAEQALDTTLWDWEPTDAGGTLWFTALFTPPEIGREKGGIRIGFEAGHDPHEATPDDGDQSLAFPDVAVPCLLLMVAHWFQNREATAAAPGMVEIPLGAQRLIPQLRIYR